MSMSLTIPMPISFIRYQNSFTDFSATNLTTRKDSKIQTNSEKEQYENQ